MVSVQKKEEKKQLWDLSKSWLTCSVCPGPSSPLPGTLDNEKPAVFFPQTSTAVLDSERTDCPIWAAPWRDLGFCARPIDSKSAVCLNEKRARPIRASLWRPSRVNGGELGMFWPSVRLDDRRPEATRISERRLGHACCNVYLELDVYHELRRERGMA